MGAHTTCASTGSLLVNEERGNVAVGRARSVASCRHVGRGLANSALDPTRAQQRCLDRRRLKEARSACPLFLIEDVVGWALAAQRQAVRLRACASADV